MNRRKFIGTLIVLSVARISGFAQSSTASHEDPDGYWTCSMHPQVHMHEPGKCPICGMPLIKTKGAKAKSAAQTETESFEVTPKQQQIIQTSKYKVELKDFVFRLAVSGRAVSSKTIAFQVYESDISSLRTGMEFIGTSSLDPSRSLKGKITFVDRIVDPSSRTVRVTGQLPDNSMDLILESGFHAEITSSTKNQIVVPEDAVLRAGRRDLVYVFSEENKLTPREVKLGAKSMREYQILSGLKEGEVISASPNFLFDSEAKIRGF